MPNLIKVEMNDKHEEIGIAWFIERLKNNNMKGINMPEADTPADVASTVNRNKRIIPGISNFILSIILPLVMYPESYYDPRF